MMNLKYYLRGLGIGILVTALIMGIATGGKEKLSNEEIKERARALGMVEEGTLLDDARAALNTLEDPEADVQEESEKPQNSEENETPEEVPGQLENEEPEQTPQQSENEEPKESLEPSKDGEPEETPEPEVIIETEGIWQPDEPDANEESITVQVMRGDSSYTVCKRLEAAGIISSASEFDTYLCQNGYDKKIRAGAFEIPENAAPEQIARILSGT